MKIKHRLKVTKHFEGKKYISCFYSSHKFLGFGFMLDHYPVQAGRERKYIFEIKLLFINFWYVRFSK